MNAPLVSEGNLHPLMNLSPAEFYRSFTRLIITAWVVPPLFGLAFIGFIQVLTVDQLIGVMLAPAEPAFNILWLIFAYWYFRRFIRPVAEYLETPDRDSGARALECMRHFPLHFWSLFLFYLLTAPASVILSAEYYTDYVPEPVDWFRIHLVALIVSIIVGLPIFFKLLDLFGRAVGALELSRPMITVRTKVFLIGALVPLLIDTMIVQYYWTRTGFFIYETFLVWLFLEVIAVAGSLIFTQSFGQSLRPLEEVVNRDLDTEQVPVAGLQPESTDEIGVLTYNFARVLDDLRVYSEILELSNQVLRETGSAQGLENVSNIIIRLTRDAMDASKVFLYLHDVMDDSLSCVASTEQRFNLHGQFRIGLSEKSMASTVFEKSETVSISDTRHDDRCNRELMERFGILSAIATPLIVDGRTAGVLMAVSDSTTLNYSKRDRLVIEALARETALAISTQQLKLDRQQAIEARQERDELVNLLMQSTEEGIFGVDMNGYCTFINATALEQLGYEDESELLGQSIHELIHHTYPDGTPYPKEECQVRVALQQGQSRHSVDEVHWRKDGTSFPVEYWSHPMYRDGKVIGAVVTFVDITERKQAEQRLAESRQRLQSIISSAELILFSIDTNGIFTLSEGKGLELLGLRPNEVTGKSVFEIYQDTPAVSEYVRRALDGESFVVDVEIGELIFETHYTPLYDENNHCIGMMGVAIDITDRVRARAELEYSSERLEIALDAGAIGIWEWDLHTQAVKWSPNVEKIFGLEPGTFSGDFDAFDRMIYPADRDKVNHAIEQALQQNRSYSVEHRIIRRDGTHRWIFGQGKVRFDDDGEPSGMIGAVIDITPIKQAEAALHKREAQLAEAQRIAHLGSWEQNLVTGEAIWSDEEYRLLGFEPGEIRPSAEHFMMRVHPDDQEKVRDAMKSAVESENGVYSVEHRMLHIDGTQKIVLDQGRVSFDGEKPVALIGTTLDITERKRIEDELRTHRDHLEEMVSDRTAELECLNAELESFSYSVSHDLRTPLRAIDGFSQALLEDYADRLDDTANDYLSRVRDATRNMSELIDDMLQLSRITRQDLFKEEVDLSLLAWEVVENYRETDPDRNVRVDIEPGLHFACDRKLIRIVMHNLVGNAWKYTEKKPQAEISIGRHGSDGQYAVFVKDNGAGFDMRFAHKIFGVFQRLHTADEFSGTGVGLATVQRIIHRHGGRVWAQSEPGEGSTFYFTV